MLSWIRRGLRTGILTTRYPKRPDSLPPNYRGAVRIDAARCRPEDGAPCVEVCLPRALTLEDDTLYVDLGRCITCGLCVDACPRGALRLDPDFELSARSRDDLLTEVRRGA